MCIRDRLYSGAGTLSGKYFEAGTALRQISLATGGTLTLKRSGKSRRRAYSLGWPSISLFSGTNCPQTRDLAPKISKKFPDPLPPPPPARLHAVRGAQDPALLGPRSQKPFPQTKIYHYTPAYRFYLMGGKTGGIVCPGKMANISILPLSRVHTCFKSRSWTRVIWSLIVGWTVAISRDEVQKIVTRTGGPTTLVDDIDSDDCLTVDWSMALFIAVVGLQVPM